jgi:hypothetical protein
MHELDRDRTLSALVVSDQRFAGPVRRMGGSKERKGGERNQSGHHGEEKDIWVKQSGPTDNLFA